MKDLSQLTFHPTAERMVELLCEKTQNSNPQFFRIMVCYYICKMASSMRVSVNTKDRGKIPVNFYGINLGVSGIGKGHSTNILEDQIIDKFKVTFFDNTLPKVAEGNLKKLSVKRLNVHNNNPNLTTPMMDFDEMHSMVTKEYDLLGKLAFSFDSGTTAAVKQMRHKLLMSGIGSMNLEMDEIGSNLLGNVDVLGTFLELFDVGKVKQKLTKNTKESVRSEEIDGKTPTNLMLFGTPAKLLDGAKTEDEFWSFISTGYGRRCFFGYTKGSGRNKNLTANDVYDKLTSIQSEQLITTLSNKFAVLASEINYDKEIQVSKDVSLLLIKYKLHCEDMADKLGEHEEMLKAELSHRYFKALKLAGGFAFIDGHGEVTEDNMYHAIAMAEESGAAFKMMLNQDKNYVKLAKYIASIGREVTHVDLIESLSFYKGAMSQKSDLMQLAIAWGYKNSVIIKRKIDNNIEFITGEKLQETNLNEMYLSHSKDIAVDYDNVLAPFDRLVDLVKMNDHHWCSHHSVNGRRSEENLSPGFNLVVLDVDGETKLEVVKILLKDYKYIIHTTKRHTQQDHRFRIIMPTNYILKLHEADFKEFMRNVYEWLPFDSDTDTGQRSRKWATTDGCQIFVNDGEPLDALLFIPRTSKNDDRQKIILSHQDMTRIERWFVTKMETGNRNNQLLKYALMLVDAGYQYVDIELRVNQLNNKLETPLHTDELKTTVFQTAYKKYIQQGGQ
jgi:hypothetical protein